MRNYALRFFVGSALRTETRHSVRGADPTGNVRGDLEGKSAALLFMLLRLRGRNLSQSARLDDIGEPHVGKKLHKPIMKRLKRRLHGTMPAHPAGIGIPGRVVMTNPCVAGTFHQFHRPFQRDH